MHTRRLGNDFHMIYIIGRVGQQGRRRTNGLNDFRRKRKTHVLGHQLDLFQLGKPMLHEKINRLLHQDLGRGGACREGDRLHPFEPFLVDVAIGIDQMRAGAQVPRHFDQPVRVRAIRRTHNQHEVGLAGTSFTATWRFSVA